MSLTKYLIVVAGPTASGKTAVSFALAQQLNTHIISADSRQFYKELTIGTAVPDIHMLRTVPHHFIHSLSIHQPYSAGQYEKDALALTEELFVARPHLILSGGSGLFIKAVCEGLDAFPDVPSAISQALQEEWKANGMDGLISELKRSDPAYAKIVDIKNPRRVMRALAVIRSGNKPYSAYLTASKAERPFVPLYYCLDLPRETLYRRIDERVGEMISAGWIGEAETLYPYRHLPALQTVGYSELFEFFEGKYSLDETVARIQQHTRNYAKRQMTWFRKYGSWRFIHPDAWEEIPAHITGKD